MKEKKTIRVTLFDVLIYTSLTFLAMQFFVNYVPLCRFFDNLGVKHYLMCAVIVVGFISDLRRGTLKVRRFTYEMKIILIMILSMIVISFAYMAANGFALFWLEQTYFIAVPLFYAYTIFKNDFSVTRFRQIITYFLIIVTIFYLIQIAAVLTGSEPRLSFSYKESTSPFESEVAHIYLLAYIFYTFNGDYRSRVFSAFFCVLAWKRIALVYIVIITIIGFMKVRNRKIKIGYPIALALVFSVVPLFMDYFLSAEFGQIFKEFTGLDFVKFSNFRYFTIQTAVKSGLKSKGLGTFFSVVVPWYGKHITVSIHNDLMRLFLEVSYGGLLLYLTLTAIIAKRRFSLYTILYLFLEMAGTHITGNGGIPFWFIGFALIFYFNNYERDGLGNMFLVDEDDEGKRRLSRRLKVKR